MKYLFALCTAVMLFAPSAAFAFKDGSYGLGLGYYSQNSFNRITKDAAGKPSLLGETFYPLNIRYDYNFWSEWFLAPQFSYSIIPRSSAGDSAKVTMMHLVFPFGKNWGGVDTTQWDWSLGPGIMLYQIKGAGGTVVMNNGTGTATFARPGQSVQVQKITFNLGLALTYYSSRFGFDLILENLMSSDKRTQSLMLSYAYQFGGGL